MEYIAKTFSGLEEILAGELRQLGAGNVTAARRAVYFTGDLLTLYRVNYLSRLSLSVLYKLRSFRIQNADDLYSRASEIEWDKHFSVADTFSVVPVVDSKIFSHSGFAGLKLKDAIADFFRKKTGRRPSVDRENPAVIVNLHISGSNATVSLDSSGAPLFKRGYRKEPGPAPLNEVLAAGIIEFSGWTETDTLIDPMCGSGTILVEAAMKASSMPAGYFRRSFGFAKWRNFDKKSFNRMKEQSDSAVRLQEGISVAGYDISEDSVNAARSNIKRAGFERIISVELKDFMELRPEMPSGYLIFNPPYGERIGADDIDRLYEKIGQNLKYHFSDYTACILSPADGPSGKIGLRPSGKYRLFNGPIECFLLKYKLYGGSRKEKKRIITV